LEIPILHFQPKTSKSNKIKKNKSLFTNEPLYQHTFYWNFIYIKNDNV
jgi:hypothetical protein